MRHPHATLAVVAFAALAVFLVQAGCSKDKGTNPPPVVQKELNSGDINGAGGSFPHTFANEGVFPYHCARHSTMPHGSVTVSDGEPAGDKSVEIKSFAFNPLTITVHTGNKVTWTNNETSAGTLHTVTSD